MLLTLKALFRKKGTISHVFAIALLVAILASVASIINHINLQAEALGKTRNASGNFLLMSKNSTSITNSKVSIELTYVLENVSIVKYIFPQKIFTATLMTNSRNYTTIVRGVDPKSYLNFRHARVNGSLANDMQANIGEILARLASIGKDDEVTLIANNKHVRIEVAGIVKTFSQLDTELVVPLSVAHILDEDNDRVSVVEFTTKSSQDEIDRLIQLLPTNVKMIEVQQTQAFIQDINNQTLSFLFMWSVAVYVTVVAASYVVATRLIIESNYELAMLRALGARRVLTFAAILAFTLSISLLGIVLGLSIGLTGAQAISTFARWSWKSIQVTPFLGIEQATQIIFIAFAASIIGCVYPAIKATRKTYVEMSL